MDEIKLTSYSHGAGCGCKISPAVLDSILSAGKIEIPPCPNLLVGNDSRDDAAAYDLGNGDAVLSTTDFFMPIVDDPFDFGGIAATNALSDIYAMGGKPLMAIAILGWPLDKLSAETAGEVLDGGRSVCAKAGIPLAGGHSIDAPEPIFGLAATGIVPKNRLKRNDTAVPGCDIFLTKPIGVGMVTTAKKMGVAEPEDLAAAVANMMELNSIGAEIAEIDGVAAMTDVTGFALLGHLREMCDGSNVSAEIEVDAVPTRPNIDKYIDLECFPGGALRNFESHADALDGEPTERKKAIISDPQTSGGLLVAVEEKAVDAFLALTKKRGLDLKPIGKTVPRLEKAIKLIP